MRYGSVCSGIEAATMAWHPLGWTPAFFSEIEAFPSAVLAHHYGSNMPGEPLAKNGIPNYGDFTTIGPDAGPIDLLVGGTPCQSFSVAGKRLGLDDPRGNLALEYLALARRLRARWIVWENVPGVLSSHTDDEQGEEDEGADGFESADFATFLSFVQECGYGFAYRVLDAQYVRVDDFARAVPQRRRRVFLVGYLGDWRRAAAVLFEPEGMRGDPAPRREAGQGTARAASSSIDGGSVSHALRGEGFDASEDGTGRGTPIVSVFSPDTAATLTRGAESSGKGGYAGRRQEDEINLVAFNPKMGADPTMGAGVNIDGTSYTLDHSGNATAIAFAQSTRDEVRLFGGDGQTVGALAAEPGMKQQSYVAQAFDMRGREGGAQFEGPHDTANIRSASGGSSKSYVAESWAVRRLTPRECERLQGFPDNFTNIPWRGKDHAPDGPRYKALGNSMAVNAMRWIGQRIDIMEKLIQSGRISA